MTQPYAAGSLLSSVDDLAVWNDAVFSGKLLKKEWLDKAFTPYTLANGESTGYGYGWFISDLRGHRCIEHGGGINGFTTYALALPDDTIYVAVLTNSAIAGRIPEPRAVRIAELVLGLAPVERKPVTLLGRRAGRTGRRLRQPGRRGALYHPRGGEAFFPARRRSQASHPGRLGDRVLFRRHADRHPLHQGRPGQGRRPARPGAHRPGRGLQTDRQAAAGSAQGDPDPSGELLDRYCGEYELMPGFSIVITNEAGHLMGQATGQPKVELFAESETDFFLKVVDAQIDLRPGRLRQGHRPDVVPGRPETSGQKDQITAIENEEPWKTLDLPMGRF